MGTSMGWSCPLVFMRLNGIGGMIRPTAEDRCRPAGCVQDHAVGGWEPIAWGAARPVRYGPLLLRRATLAQSAERFTRNE